MEDNNIPGLNINGENLTNQDIFVVYTPNSSISNYRYRLYKDNNIINEKNITSNQKSTIVLDETGLYHLEIVTHDIYGRQEIYKSKTYHLDKTPPVIEVKQDKLEIKLGSSFDLYDNIVVTDNVDGNINNKVTSNYKQLKPYETGVKKLIYTVSDEAGNMTTKTVDLHIVDNYSSTLIYIQMLIIVALIGVVVFLLKYRRTLKLERRISPFSVLTLKDNSISLFDGLTNYYYKMIYKLSNILKKSAFITKYSKRYNKYVSIIDSGHKTGYDFIASKFITSFIFLLIAIFSKAIQFQVLYVYEIFLPLLIGFFLPDLLYWIKYRLYQNKIENDLLQAIIVMNNAFKSGRSIIQAIDLVSVELDGAIADEFKKMSLELSLGLELEVVFNRFAERIQVEEVSYLTASLSILNKTGGNIVNIFFSIEKSLFNRKQLKLELASLTGSSKLLVYVLFLVPILFVIFVGVINPFYFLPFFTTTIGLVLLVGMLVYYIIYIIVIQKIMKVRM
ncbi:MAG: type II secretion system F family protein [Bacilli bacterium]|nr:type II secretion system F family protein [Bacilli bacterium]MDD4808481.1 type II secretion system F family protein [Bacilli bacterium]